MVGVVEKHSFLIFHVGCKPEVGVVFFKVWNGFLGDSFEERRTDVEAVEPPDNDTLAR
jgi:hypothetical protein